MTAAYSLAVISDRLQAFTRQLDSDPNLPGRLLLFSGTRPAPGQPVLPDGLVLARLVLYKPSLFSVNGTVLTLKNPEPVLVQSSGLAAWGRYENGVGQHVADIDVGVDGDIGVECIIRKADNTAADTTMLFAGGEFSVVLARHVET